MDLNQRIGKIVEKDKGFSMKTEPIRLNASDARRVSPEDINADAMRNHVLQATRDFKNSWRNLARVLQVVRKEKLYRKWGYDTFDHYTAKEVTIRKHTAMKLIRSYMFLKNEEPLYLQSSKDTDGAQGITPTLEATNTLRYAKKALNDDEYQKVRNDLLEGSKDPREVKKDLTALIIKRRKDIDPEKERTFQNKAAIEKFLLILRTFKREIETLYLLPGFIAEDIDILINKIEKHTSK